MATRDDYIHTKEGNPHLTRMRQILGRYPEVKQLFGNNPWTGFFTFILVALQVGLAASLNHASWWLILPLSYVVGATANHALYVVIHECAHNLVFKGSTANRLLGIFANFPQVFPSSVQFAKYHTLHHSNQSEYDFDADLASYAEARWIGNSPWRKALSLSFFGLVQGVLRPRRLEKVRFWDAWFVLNVIIQLAFIAAFFWLSGGKALAYLLLSTLFSLGMHPLGARWIQEHYVMKEGQETYSYYGPLNKVCFNMGYHNEHHDFIRVPWSRLPRLKSMAPEFYEPLYCHRSWTRLLIRFIRDPELSFFSRIVRPSKKKGAALESLEASASELSTELLQPIS